VAKHWIAVGAACQAQEEYSQAEHAYQMALILENENISALFYMAQVCYAQQKEEVALDHLKQLVTLSPNTEEETRLFEKSSLILGLTKSQGGAK
jgi:cytochrome c-type biogenesis protein CcmH/NrfG